MIFQKYKGKLPNTDTLCISETINPTKMFNE